MVGLGLTKHSDGTNTRTQSIPCLLASKENE